MIHRFRQGTIKSIGLMALPESEVRSHLQTSSDDEPKADQPFYRDKFSDFRPSNALRAPLTRALACNALAEISAPWNLSKDSSRKNYWTRFSIISPEKRFSLADAEWGRLPDGHVVGKQVPLFPRIEG